MLVSRSCHFSQQQLSSSVQGRFSFVHFSFLLPTSVRHFLRQSCTRRRALYCLARANSTATSRHPSAVSHSFRLDPAPDFVVVVVVVARPAKTTACHVRVPHTRNPRPRGVEPCMYVMVIMMVIVIVVASAFLSFANPREPTLGGFRVRLHHGNSIRFYYQLAVADDHNHSLVGNKIAVFVLQSLGCDVAAINTVNFSPSVRPSTPTSSPPY